jgi:hypothetical protein
MTTHHSSQNQHNEDVIKPAKHPSFFQYLKSMLTELPVDMLSAQETEEIEKKHSPY